MDESSRGTILTVEDERPIQDLIARVLRDAGYTVVTAQDGQQGLEMAISHRPDLIVLDLALPIMDGIDVLTRLRADPAHAKTPVIVLSARRTPTEIARAKEAGATLFLTKPFGARTLLEYVAGVLRKRESVLLVPARKPTDEAKVWLIRAGYEVPETADLGHALEVAQEIAIAALCLDLDLLAEDAVASLRRVRETLGPVPVLAVGMADPSPGFQALLPPHGEFLRKPLKQSVLLSALDRIARSARETAEAMGRGPAAEGNWAAACRVEKEEIQGRARSVSRQGLTIDLPRPLKRETPVRVVIFGEGITVAAQGVVAWSERAVGSDLDIRVRHGITFTAMSDSDQERLGAFIAKGGRPA